jgi:glycosyltransferase involved in cell wall biosynthesis
MTKNARSVSPAAIGLRRLVSQTIRWVWKQVPLPFNAKDRVIGAVFRRLPILVSWSGTYRNWRLEGDRLEEARRQRHVRQPLKSGRRTHTELSGLPRPAALTARAIAFYLPQFHPIPENDAWWGTGFTEWTNVTRAKPQFEGHDQPVHPAELGYYNLLEQPYVRRRQASLASQYGLEGFCFYFYWFAGKRLLEQPIAAYASDTEIDFPFCLCWANESWSRTWDGLESEVLIAQQHSPEDDIAFISHLAAYLRNPKYIRVRGRPLILVYRVGLLPDPKATSERWRAWCQSNGLGEIYLVCVQSFDSVDPTKYGFDAATEFAPNNMGMAPETDLTYPLSDDFQCKTYDWSHLTARSVSYGEFDYKIFRSVTPRWDNTARRMSRASIFLGANPADYAEWLSEAANDVEERFKEPSERIVFINAWNEWAEGAYLEPDVTYGYAWLEATRLGLQSEQDAGRVEPADLVHDQLPAPKSERPKIILVVHDLHPHGAQFLSLNLVATLHGVFGYDVATIACGDGELRGRFSVYGKVIDARPDSEAGDALRIALGQLVNEGFGKAIVNSSASGWLAPHLSDAGIACVGLVHELPELIANMQLERGLFGLDAHANAVIFASRQVEERTATEVLGHPWKNPVIQPQGLYKRDGILSLEEKEPARRRLCKELGLPAASRFVIGVGYGDRRKGVDIFCRWALAAAAQDANLHFVWVGGVSDEMKQASIDVQSAAPEFASNLHFVGFKRETGPIYAAASAFALTSREDPYPSSAIEALDAGVPVFMIAGSGGVADLEGTGAVTVLPDDDAEKFSARLVGLLTNPDALERSAHAGMEVARQHFGFTSFVGDVLRLLEAPIPKVSVVIPNYNYSRYLPQRIASVLNQSVPVWEIIFLDDASSDDSVAVARQLLHNCSIRYRIVENTKNSGSVSSQWQKGVDLAQGDLVWIAEADDWAARDFVKIASAPFSDPAMSVSYTQSNQVSGSGEILSASYLDYIADVDASRWRKPFVSDGASELASGLSVKNTLPNVSGVIFDRAALQNVLGRHMDEIMKYRVAGDWCVYALLAMTGNFAYDPRPMNYHRRHESSVTISRFTRAEWNEIRDMQAFVASMVDVPDDFSRRAKEYLDHLERRLD